MDLSADRNRPADADPMELVEICLSAAGWDFQRDEDDGALQCLAHTRWGEMGGLFAIRREPPALHFP